MRQQDPSKPLYSARRTAPHGRLWMTLSVYQKATLQKLAALAAGGFLIGLMLRSDSNMT
ncbi:MAG: hypothetical protein FRX49_10465 [Trebouxia sp. A1-2]|nr:MAG: hypothetical protein FRX49_10465 [Trebouxia sp. A1-2]